MDMLLPHMGLSPSYLVHNNDIGLVVVTGGRPSSDGITSQKYKPKMMSEEPTDSVWARRPET